MEPVGILDQYKKLIDKNLILITAMTDCKGVECLAHYKNTKTSFLKEGYSFDYEAENHSLAFLLSGSVRIKVDHDNTVVIDRPTMFLLPKDKHYDWLTLAPTRLLCFPLISEKLSLSLLTLTKNQIDDKIVGDSLPSFLINEQCCTLITYFAESISFSLLNETYYELKLAELMYLIKLQFSEEERIRFFSPIIDDVFLFSDFIMTNYKHVNNIKELAELSYYSQSGFDKKFKRIFKTPPSLWLKEKKKIGISGDLYYSNKSLKEISLECGFCSPTHFSKYCKSVFGATPGELRKKREENE